MREILRTQLRQILGGRRKWLVLAALVLPVLLVWATATFGVLNELREEIDPVPTVSPTGEPLPPSATARRVEWDGEDLEFIDGSVKVLRDRILAYGRRLRSNQIIDINRGWIVLRDGVMWLDETRRRPGGHIHVSWRGCGDFDIPWSDACAIFLFLLYPQSMCLLLALFYGSSLLAARREYVVTDEV